MESLNNLDKVLEKKLKNINSYCNNFYYQEELFLCDENFKNKFYFENLTDDCFFDCIGAKNEFVEFYKKIIKSGVGLIILGGVKPGLSAQIKNNQARISLCNETLSKYKIITKFAHSNQSKILLKIKPDIGRFCNSKNNKTNLKYGSDFCLDPENRKKLVLRTSDNKCNDLISDISQTVHYSNISGFDGVLIDASLSNIIGELSSIELNKRVFGYYSNSDDFLTRLLKNINAKNNFIIIKINILTLYSYKNKHSNLCDVTQNLNTNIIIKNLVKYIELGVDGFEFVFGRIENEFFTNFNQFESPLLFEEFVEEFQKYLKQNNIQTTNGKDVLILYKDNFYDFEKPSYLIKNKVVNLIDITRNIYSDINFLKNIKNAKKVKNCLKCSYCNKISKENQIIDCLINPELMSFEVLNLEPNKIKVAVIGSGISSLICSIILAKRGFIVDLFEQSNELNPIGKLTTIFEFDKTLTDYFKFINDEINFFVKNKKINLNLNTRFDTETKEYSNYKSIIIGTGFKTKFLSVSGAVQSHVVNIYDALKHSQKLLTKKNIVIYAKTELSLKLALYLLSNKKKITLIIKDLKLFLLNKNANLFYYFYKLYNSNSKILFLSRITKINEDNIDVIINNNINTNTIDDALKLFSNSKIKDGNRQINLDCDYLIYEPELTPNNKLFIDIVNKRYKGEVYLIGNALEISDLAESIKSGYFVGKNL